MAKPLRAPPALRRNAWLGKGSARRGPARTLGACDDGAIHVVEALLAGMIILTAVLFLTNVSKPSPPAAEAGIDLEGVARDVLVVLENRPATPATVQCTGDTPDPACYPSRLDQVAGSALGYNVDAAKQTTSNSDATDFLNQVIPVGNRWLLRLDNGVEPLVLLPASGSNVQLTPRAAKAAETFIMPPWQANGGPLADGKCGPPPTDPKQMFTPGGPETNDEVVPRVLDVAAGDPLHAPAGSLPPAGTVVLPPRDPATDPPLWSEWWVQEQQSFKDRDEALLELDPGLGLEPLLNLQRIPPTAMYGWWWLDHDGSGSIDDSNECYFVGLPEGVATDYPVYGVQLVVWPIAG